MKNHKNAGFTLIELLVVVLIIGILSAFALPQYTKAVERSRVAEAETVLASLYDAQARCIMANGDKSTCWRELFANMDISLGLPKVQNGGLGECYQGKTFLYCMDGDMIVARNEKDGYFLDASASNPSGAYQNHKIGCVLNGSKCQKIGYTVDLGVRWVKP